MQILVNYIKYEVGEKMPRDLCALRGYFFLLYIMYNIMCSSKSDRREDFLAVFHRKSSFASSRLRVPPTF